jgi:hypothetical protein
VIQYGQALQLFRAWRDEKTLLACESSLFSIWHFAARGRVDSVDDDGLVHFVAEGGAAAISLDLSNADGIEYGETPESRASILLVAIPMRVRRASLERDSLIFTELAPPS